MRRILLFAGSLFIAGAAFTQITVTQWNIAGPGDVVIQDQDTMPSITAPSGGANQTWNYSTGLTVHVEDTLSFAAPGWMNNGSYFPTATLGATQSNGFEIYLINDASSLRSVGAAADLFGTGDKQVYVNPAEVMIQYPANYNDAYTTSSIQKLSIPGSDVGAPLDSIVNKTYLTKDVTIDAWGALTTPYGTFNVLRMNEIKYSADSTWGYIFGNEQLLDNNFDTSYTYTFWSDDPSARFPVMDMSHDNMGTIYNVTWLKEAPSAGLSTENKIETKLYPNPASEVIILEADADQISGMNIYDVTGTLVKKVNVLSLATAVDVSTFNNGVYLFELLNNNNDIIQTERIVVKH